MKHNQLRQVVFPILAAFIWGTAFVAQDLCAERHRHLYLQRRPLLHRGGGAVGHHRHLQRVQQG